VGSRQLKVSRGTDRPLPVSIWYPATGEPGGPAHRGAKVAAGRFPVVLFSHGLTALPADYQALLTRWAAAGFVVVAPAYPHTGRGTPLQVLDVANQPADASYVLTRVLDLERAGADPLRGHLDPARVAAAGHSAGGITTVGLFTVARDPRLTAGIVLAGSALGFGARFAGPPVPLLFVHGQRDEVVPYADGLALYRQVPWPRAMLSLPDGDHGRSLQRPGDQGFDVVSAATTEFLRWSLHGDPAAKRRLATAAGAGGVATLDDHL
jgi:pimeloyl-ACP methyl ester carboxylesterase